MTSCKLWIGSAFCETDLWDEVLELLNNGLPKRWETALDLIVGLIGDKFCKSYTSSRSFLDHIQGESESRHGQGPFDATI